MKKSIFDQVARAFAEIEFEVNSKKFHFETGNYSIFPLCKPDPELFICLRTESFSGKETALSLGITEKIDEQFSFRKKMKDKFDMVIELTDSIEMIALAVYEQEREKAIQKMKSQISSWEIKCDDLFPPAMTSIH